MPRSWFPEISRDYHKHCNPCWSFLEQIWQNQFLWRWQKPSKGLEPSLCHYFDRFYVCLRPLVFTLSCFTLPRGIPVTNHAVSDHQVVQSFALEVNSKFCPKQKHWMENLFFFFDLCRELFVSSYFSIIYSRYLTNEGHMRRYVWYEIYCIVICV